MLVLLAGLWWVQVVSGHDPKAIWKRNRIALSASPPCAEKFSTQRPRAGRNRPRYNLGLYLDDLRKPFDVAYGQALAQAGHSQKQRIAAQEKILGRSLSKAERKQFAFTPGQLKQLHEQSRFAVAAGVVEQVSRRLGQPLTLEEAEFNRHYETRLALPYPLLPNLNGPRKSRVLRSNTPAAWAWGRG